MGDDASFKNLFGGPDSDDITIGDRANFVEIDKSAGTDTISIGDDVTGAKVSGGSGDDLFFLGANANIADKIDGQGGTDTLNTQTAGVSHQDIENFNVVCFTHGTQIVTATGDVPVEDLRPGDLLRTLDHGHRPLLWTGRTDVDAEVLRLAPRLAPVRIAAGALGPGIPCRDLVVSPQHRVFVASSIAERLSGHAQVLVAARKLIGAEGITALEGCGGVTYFHLLLKTHEILFSEGAASESMYLGDQTLKTLSAAQRLQIQRLLPGPAPLSSRHYPARPFLARRQKIAKLIARHARNAKPLQPEDTLDNVRAAARAG